MTKNDLLVVVDGDTTVDWAVKRAREGFLAAEERLTAECSTHWLWGGAFLLTHLVDQAAENAIVCGLRPMEKYPAPDDKRVHHSFNTLDKLPRDSKTGKPKKDAKWRVSNFLGFHCQQGLEPYPADSLQGNPDLVVVNDSALGFSRAGGPWSRVPGLRDADVEGDGGPWVFLNLRLRRATGEDDLWNLVHGQIGPDALMARRLVVLTTVDSLRNVGAEVSRGLSWEKSAFDVLRELHGNPTLKTLQDCTRLIVTFGPSGALLVDYYNDPPYELIFDTEHTEGSWDRDHKDGKMFGYTQALTAAVASRIVSSACAPLEAESEQAAEFHNAVCDGIEYGLRCMHRIYDRGFAEPSDTPSVLNSESTWMKDEDVKPAVVGERPPAPRIGKSTIHPPKSSRVGAWSILEEVYSKEDALDVAIEIVHRGREHLSNVPIGQFEDFLSVDRRELEALRSVQNLIAEYLDDADKTKPRSIAVFGAPGDGKSFAVTQVAKSLGAEEALTFNLSQFASPRDFIGALHQVRDGCLAGVVPLVFWDEFDTTLGTSELGWLRFFLAPMQDGKFQEEQVTHHVGRCIFVFAGGTSKSYAEFLEKSSVFKNAKVVDFASRLRGYVDVVGVNPPSGSIVDLRVLARRAILLNEFLKRAGIKEGEDGRIAVDDEVARAFLKIPNYRNGTRSMEAIVDMSRLHKGGRFGRSSLPPKTQLELHVKASDFLRLASNSPTDWLVS
ncbi:hypothetical protein [Streptomyces sp. NPDC007856]|uniref:hypothetical protein n=1 Tax=Streptomyces sp. NPDC007856 TaxID=3364781 RepID=UPI0036BAC0A5